MNVRIWVPVMLVLGLAGCGERPGDGLVTSGATLVVADSALAGVSAVFHDGITDVYFVSNMNGGPMDRDANGFLSLVSGDGRVEVPRFIDAARDGVAMHAPKGVAVLDTTMYVTDMDTIWLFHRDRGELLGSVRIPGATALHAIVPDESMSVVLTDAGFRMGANGPEPSGTDAVYRLWSGGRLDTLAMGPELNHPTGVGVRGDSVWVAGSTAGEVYRIEAGRKVDVQATGGQVEGLVVTEIGIFVTDPAGGRLLRGSPGGAFTVVAEGLPAPRAVSFDRWRFHLLVVTGQGTEFRAIPLAF